MSVIKNVNRKMDFRDCQISLMESNQAYPVNIDDGLCAQDNEMFLKASMAFLHQHAKRKLGIEEHPIKAKRIYSNLLLFENFNGPQKERYFLELKNPHKFDQIIESETNVNVLSNAQILPKVKKPSRLYRLFRIHSNNHKSKSKKALKEVKVPDVTVNQSTDCLSEYTESLNVNCSKTNWNLELQKKFQGNYANPEYLDELLKNPEHSLRVKESVRWNLRTRKTESLASDYEETTEEIDEQFQQFPVNAPMPVLPKRGAVKRQQSKLSICLEDESDSEEERKVMSYSNIPDELKAQLPSEVMQKVLNEMIDYLEQSPSN